MLLSLFIFCLHLFQNSCAHPNSNPNFCNYLSPLNSKIGKVQNKDVFD